MILDARSKYRGTSIQYNPEILIEGTLWTVYQSTDEVKQGEVPDIIVTKTINHIETMFADQRCLQLELQVSHLSNRMNGLKEHQRMIIGQQAKDMPAKLEANEREIDELNKQLQELVSSLEVERNKRIPIIESTRINIRTPLTVSVTTPNEPNKLNKPNQAEKPDKPSASSSASGQEE